MYQDYKIEKYGEHFCVVDASGNFISSADTFSEACSDIQSMLGKENKDAGRLRGSS